MNQIGNLVYLTIFFFKLYAAHYSGLKKPVITDPALGTDLCLNIS